MSAILLDNMVAILIDTMVAILLDNMSAILLDKHGSHFVRQHGSYFVIQYGSYFANARLDQAILLDQDEPLCFTLDTAILFNRSASFFKYCISHPILWFPL